MTSLTFDTTEVFILSANSAAAPGTPAVLIPESTALTACFAAVFLLLASAAFGAATVLVLPAAFAAGLAAFAAVAFTALGAGLVAAAFTGAALALVFAVLFAGRFGAALAGAFGAAGLALTAGFFAAGLAAFAATFAAGLAAGFTALAAALGAGLALLAGAALALPFATGREAGLPTGAACALGLVFLASADAEVLAALAAPAFLADFVTVSFILPSRCLPLAAVACWQFSRQTKAMHGETRRITKPG